MKMNEIIAENAQPKPAKPGTENHETQDVKPKTRNAQPETLPVRRPKFSSFDSSQLPDSGLENLGQHFSTKNVRLVRIAEQVREVASRRRQPNFSLFYLSNPSSVPLALELEVELQEVAPGLARLRISSS